MRLLCWNLYNRRAEPSQALDLVARSDADLLALQEATPALADVLERGGGWHLHRALDFTEKGEAALLLVASRAPSRARIVPVNAERRTSPSLLGRLAGWAECLEALVVEIGGPRPLTLANLHLTCAAGPGYRRRELETVLAALPAEGERLLCGDFNSFAQGWWRLAGPLLGFAWRDYRVDELAALDAPLAARGLRRLPARLPSFPRLGLSLDQVAVSAGLAGARLSVLPDCHGSDHRPLLVELAPP